MERSHLVGGEEGQGEISILYIGGPLGIGPRIGLGVWSIERTLLSIQKKVRHCRICDCEFRYLAIHFHCCPYLWKLML